MVPLQSSTRTAAAATFLVANSKLNMHFYHARTHGYALQEEEFGHQNFHSLTGGTVGPNYLFTALFNGNLHFQ